MGKKKRVYKKRKTKASPDIVTIRKANKRVTALVVAVMATLTIAIGIFALNQKMQIDQLEQQLRECKSGK